jgi:hypothetical protein
VYEYDTITLATDAPSSQCNFTFRLGCRPPKAANTPIITRTGADVLEHTAKVCWIGSTCGFSRWKRSKNYSRATACGSSACLKKKVDAGWNVRILNAQILGYLKNVLYLHYIVRVRR